MALVCLFLVTGSLIANSTKKSKPELVFADVNLESIKDEKNPEPKPIPLKQSLSKVEIIQFTLPKIVKDEDVQPDEEIKEVALLDDTKIGTINQKGT